MPSQRLVAFVFVISATLAAYACGGDGPTGSGGAAKAPVPTSAAVASGSDQTGAVGTALSQPLVVKVLGQNGRALAGVAVSWSTASGSLSAATSTTDAGGLAQVTWTLGTKSGSQSAEARVGTLTPVAFGATAVAGPPAAIQKSAGDAQAGTAGEALSSPVSVRVTDAHGNPVAGAAVAWSVTAGGGSVTGSGSAGSDGIATAQWTLGSTAGSQTVSASVASLGAVHFTAEARAGAAAAAVVAGGDAQTSTVGSALPVPLTARVVDRHGNPVAGVAVSWAVAAGGGTVSPAAAQTNASGEAAATWTLGTVAGANTVTATPSGLPALTFTATASPGAPAAVTRLAGDAQTAMAGTAVAVAPSVEVRDAHGNPVPGAAVSFAVASGGGTVSGASATANAQGVATVGSWTLGAAGENTLTATVSGLQPLTFTATATQPSGLFNIEVRYIVAPTDRQRQSVDAAVARWRQIIVGDLPDVDMTGVPAGCGNPEVTGVVDDLVVFVDFSEIDGAGSTLGMAGPCYVRPSNLLPITGQLRLDAADLAAMEGDGTLDEVVLHEIGHALGIGTLWSEFSLIAGSGGSDPYFVGAGARSGFLQIGGGAYVGNIVPVENSGGEGTREGHWRETTLANELMTGLISAAGNPLSAVTIGSLADMGYVVDTSVADSFSYTSQGPAGYQVGGFELREGPSPRPILVPPGRELPRVR